MRRLESEVARTVLRAYSAWTHARAIVEQLRSDGLSAPERTHQVFAFERLRRDLVDAVANLGVERLFDALANEGAHGHELEELEGVYSDLSEGEPAHCRRCGCTDLHACPGGCSWVEFDLCSSCAGWWWEALSA
jgi:hypothetical protein